MLKIQGIVLIVTCVALSATSAARFKLYRPEREVKEFQMDRGDADGKVLRMLPNDRGNFTNCGEKSYKFQIQWSPVVINIQDSVTLYWDFVAANDCSSGTLHIEVSLPDDPQSILFSFDQEGNCVDIKSAMPSIDCPVKKGDEIKGQTTISDLTRLPTGTYTLEVKLTNDKNLLVLCARGTVELTE